LGNVQAGELVKRIDHAGLQTILLGHLSEQNNTDQAAADTMSKYLPAADNRVTVLQQHNCSVWFDIQSADDDVKPNIDSAAKGTQTQAGVPEETGQEKDSSLAELA